ncbi:MAG: GGDEF domain-containing protein [Alkaliphilus sp.]|nr:GGDEF domain-containing protein [Alkaliphilus sp.]
MLSERFKLKTCFAILIDKSGKIYFCNREANDCEGIMNELGILSSINEGKLGERIFEDYFVNIREISIHGEKLYFMVINYLADKYSFLEHSVFLDYQTRLYNRNFWEYLYNDLVNLLDCQNFYVVIIDIDNLKEINDSKGHGVGDLAISIVAATLKESVRKEDVVIRLGGDEFLCILPNIEKEVSIRLIDRIKKGLIEKSEAANLDIGISIGISFGDKFECVESIVQRADFNMYTEKRRKKTNNDAEKSKKINELIETTKLLLDNIEEIDGGLVSTEVLKKVSSLRQLVDELTIKKECI